MHNHSRIYPVYLFEQKLKEGEIKIHRKLQEDFVNNIQYPINGLTNEIIKEYE